MTLSEGYNDTIILFLLMDQPSYGYQVSKMIRELSEEKYIIKETTLYSAFTRLEKNGYVESFAGRGESGGKQRTYYRITEEGRRYYEEKCLEWQVTKESSREIYQKEGAIMEIILNYLDSMFTQLPDTEEVRKGKREMASMMEDKYVELKAEGKSENEAIGIVISEFGNMEELIRELGIREKSAPSITINEDKRKPSMKINLSRGKGVSGRHEAVCQKDWNRRSALHLLSHSSHQQWRTN